MFAYWAAPKPACNDHSAAQNKVSLGNCAQQAATVSAEEMEFGFTLILCLKSILAATL